MGPSSYMRPLVDRNDVMRRMTVVQTTNHRTETVCEVPYTMRHVGVRLVKCVFGDRRCNKRGEFGSKCH